MGRRFSSGFSKFRIPHHPCRQLPRIPLIRICYPDPSADCGRPPTCRMGFGIATALAAWLLLPPPPVDRRARIHHGSSTCPAYQWPSTRAVPHARRSVNPHFDWTSALRLLPQFVTQPRRLGASAVAASDAGLADAAAGGSWGTVYWRLSGVAAVVASLIVQVTARAPVRIGSAASQVRGLDLAARLPQPHAPVPSAHPMGPADGTPPPPLPRAAGLRLPAVLGVAAAGAAHRPWQWRHHLLSQRLLLRRQLQRQ